MAVKNQQDVKFREGELSFVESKSTIKEFLKSLATDIVTQEWIPYDKSQTNRAWTFDLRREVILPNTFKPENIRIFKASIDEITNDYEKGEEISKDDYLIINNILRGIGGKDSGTEIGDTILVEVNYEAEEFQRVTFLETQLPSGQVEYVANLKAKPKGQVLLYEDTIHEIKDEELHQDGGNEIYRFSRRPISNSEGDHKVQIRKNGKEVPEDEYTVDYFNGILIFYSANEDTDEIRADYGVRTGKRGDLIEEDRYRIFQDKIISKDPELNNLDVVVDVDYYWSLHYPERIEDIEVGRGSRIVLKTELDISSAQDRSKLKTYYWELRTPDLEDKEDIIGEEDGFKGETHDLNGKPLDKEDILERFYHTGVLTRYGATLDKEDTTTLDDKLSSDWVKWSWFISNGFDKGLVLNEENPIKYWISFTKENINMVLQGDPGVDAHPYDNYMISYAFVGKIDSYDGAKEDLDDNFAFTVCSDLHPEDEGEYSSKWGQKTGTGVTDILMERTDSNMPYQAHYPAFHTVPEFMDKHFIHVSEFTGSHHFSEITVVHGVERERGKLPDVLIGDKSSIFHLDELVTDKDIFDFRGALVGKDGNFLGKCGDALESKEKKWLMFNIKAPYSFLNNSPNVHYGIAIRKS